jgi:Holliday junction resolvasome RuvABC endonuclease subunit
MNKPSNFMALDCATTNTGLAVFYDGELVDYGKLYFEGDTQHEKCASAAILIYGYLTDRKVDAIVIESSFVSFNPNVATNLAMSHGAVIGAAALTGVDAIGSVGPLQWQSGIGNPQLTPKEKSDIMATYQGKTTSWYKAQGRKVRKERTISIVNDYFGIDTRDNDVADAIGIGLYVLSHAEKVKW